MKKSQILAALALAFALGVVAPVAGLANAIDHTAQSATCGEVSHVIDVVNGNATYKAMLKLKNDVAKYTGTDNEATVKGDITTAMSSLQTAGVAVSSIPGSSASLTDTKNAAVTNVANYSIYNALYNAIKDPTTASLTTFKTNVQSYNAIENVTPVIADYSWADWAAVVADTNVITGGSIAAGVISGTWAFQNYTLYTTLIGAVEAATEFTTGMNALEADLLALGVAQADIDATATPAARGALAATKVNGYAAYITNADSVDAEMSAALACSAANEAANAYGYITDIATALKKADSAAYGSKTVKEVADILLGAAAPVLPENPDNKPEDGDKPGDNNGDDQKDPSAPGTGVLSSADGNAATTVSIVAGLATALTALGAGVVAYRSARRSNK